jgi:hypothetical protein
MVAGQIPVLHAMAAGHAPCNCMLWQVRPLFAPPATACYGSVTCMQHIACSCRLHDLHYSIDLGGGGGALLCFGLTFRYQRGLAVPLLWVTLTTPQPVSSVLCFFLHVTITFCPSCPRLQAATIHCEPSKLKRSEIHPTSSPPICRVIKKEHERGREAETMCSPNLVKEPAIKTVILSDDTAPKTEPVRCARERETQN